MGIGDDIRKLLLAGVGLVATTVEKSKEVVELLIKKGELAMGQGKVNNEELKHNAAGGIHKNTSVQEGETPIPKPDTLSPAEIAALKAMLIEMENKDDGKGNTGPA
jgi:uncharacterized protein involved in high-affinity Fe2+ transport